MEITEKIAYIKGVAEGMNLDRETKEGKLISLIIEALDDIAMTVSDLEEETGTLNDYVEEIDEDLGALEDDFYGEDEDEDDEDCCCDDEDCCCDDEDSCTCGEECDCCQEDDAVSDFYETVCPQCGDKVYLDDSIDPSRVICPSCHNEFTVAAE